MKNKTSYSILQLVSILLYISITRLAILDTIYNAILSQIAILLIPYLIGKLFLFLMIKFKLFNLKEKIPSLVAFTVLWSLGTIILIISETILYVNYLFDTYVFSYVILFLCLISIFVSIPVDYEDLQEHKKIFIFLIIYSLLFSLFVTYYWNFPYANENDYIRHAFYIYQIVYANRPLLFYSPYLPTMHTLFAVVSVIFNIKDTLILIWTNRFLLAPLYIIGLYLASWVIAKNKKISVITACLGISLVYGTEGSILPWQTAPKNFITIFYMYLLYAGLFLISKNKNYQKRTPLLRMLGLIFTFNMILFISLFLTSTYIGYEIGNILLAYFFVIHFVMIFIKGYSKDTYYYLTIISSSIILFHKINGFIATFAVLLFLSLLRIFYKREKILKGLFASTFIFLSLLYTVFYFRILDYPKRPLIALPTVSLFLFGWNNVMMYLSEIYPEFILYFFALGCIIIIFKREIMLLGAVSISSVSLIFYFAPIYASYRFLIYAHPFIVLIATYFVVKCSEVISKIFLKFLLLQKSLKMPYNSRKKLSIVISLLILMVPISVMTYQHDIYLLENPKVTYLQNRFVVFEIGEFLRNNVKDNAIIIGGSNGPWWYQGISAFYGNKWPLYLWINDEYHDEYLEEIYLAPSSKDAYFRIKQLLNNKYLLVSYYDPQYIDVYRHYRYPEEIIILYDDGQARRLKNIDSIGHFMDPRYFDYLYVTQNMYGDKFYIFRMKNNPVNYKNLVLNPSFEIFSDKQIIPNWKINATRKIYYEYSLDNDSFDGYFSLKISTNTTLERTWVSVYSQSINVIPNKTYFIATHMKYYNVKESHIKIIGYYSNISKWDTLKGAYVPSGRSGDSGWYEYCMRLKIPSNVTLIKVVLMAGWVNNVYVGPAITWFDDIVVIGPI